MEKYNEVKDKIPLLRFRNFQQCKSWNKGTIDSIIECESSQLTLGKLNLSDNGYPIYGADGIIGYITFYNKSHMYISIVKDGSGVGRLNLCQAYSSLLGTLNYLFSKDEKAYQIQWIYYLLQTIDFSNYIKGSGIPHIYFNDYKKHIIYIPSFDEQREIADCLSSLDELIEATAQKVETLKEHKKGLMQRLFPAERKNVPDLRFPEFKGAEEWNGYKLKSLCKIGNGKDYKHLGSGNIPLYGSGGYMTSVDDFLYDGESVCIGRKGTIDKPIFLTGKFWTVDTLFYTHSFHNCLPKFLYLIFQQINWYKYNEAGGVPSLSKTTIGEINVFVPVGKKGELKEQQKIADCLFSLDELIEATSRKVEILKEHKKGLMQQLFPKI